MIRFRLGINGVLSLLLSTALPVAIAIGNFKMEASKVTHELVEELIELPDLIHVEPEVESKTLEVHSTVLPSDPDNAALLYYQAFLLCPELDTATTELRDKVLRGAEPDEKIRKYLKRCRKTIKLAEAAAQITQCNWGILYSQGFGFNSVPLRHLTFLLGVDARILAADGDYRAAVGRCLTIRQLAGHVGDYTLFRYGVSVGFDKIALGSIQHILGVMPSDFNNLTRLQGQLAVVQGASRSPARVLERDFEFALQNIDPEILARVRDHIVKNTEDTNAKKEIRSLTDEELLVRARESYSTFLNSVLRAIGSDMPYEKTYAELQRLTDKLGEQASSNPVIILSLCAGQVVKVYELHVRHTAYFNALKAAIEIYLSKAKTGQLPKTLPDYLPKDPYSGEDFEYETTKEGFVLRCRVKDIDEGKIQQYEFKVQK